MKQILLLLVLGCLFCGCASNPKASSKESVAAVNQTDPDRAIWSQPASGSNGYQF